MCVVVVNLVMTKWQLFVAKWDSFLLALALFNERPLQADRCEEQKDTCFSLAMYQVLLCNKYIFVTCSSFYHLVNLIVATKESCWRHSKQAACFHRLLHADHQRVQAWRATGCIRLYNVFKFSTSRWLNPLPLVEWTQVRAADCVSYPVDHVWILWSKQNLPAVRQQDGRYTQPPSTASHGIISWHKRMIWMFI